MSAVSPFNVGGKLRCCCHQRWTAVPALLLQDGDHWGCRAPSAPHSVFSSFHHSGTWTEWCHNSQCEHAFTCETCARFGRREHWPSLEGERDTTRQRGPTKEDKPRDKTFKIKQDVNRREGKDNTELKKSKGFIRSTTVIKQRMQENPNQVKH